MKKTRTGEKKSRENTMDKQWQLQFRLVMDEIRGCALQIWLETMQRECAHCYVVDDYIDLTPDRGHCISYCVDCEKCFL